ncbi:MAG: hypothetical protein K1X78_27570 [Verrucomicrobiaceae bacterium]|nr:hypothetical protein [Verrucomicrobiaceae bacterium]
MKTIHRIFALLVLIPDIAFAQTSPPPPALKAVLKTLDGKIYTDVKLIEVEADGIRIAHAAGVAKLPLEMLPEEARKSFADEVAKKAAMQATIEASRRGEQERLATEKEMSTSQASTPALWRPESMKLVVLEVRPDGVVAKRDVRDSAMAALPVFVEGVKGKPKGQMWSARIIRAGTWRHESRTLPKYRLAR